MELNRLNREFGTGSQNKIAETNQQSIEGAIACLETFYYGFNNRDLSTLKKVWQDNELIQLNNPLGGIKRGTNQVLEVYDKIFKGQARVWVKFTDIIYYATDKMVVFAGTEIGEFHADSETIALKIRTTRIIGFPDDEKGWLQLHHHGSIDNPELLLQYQNAVNK